MKRGFLLKSEGRKVLAGPKDSQETSALRTAVPGAQHSTGLNAKVRLFASGNLTEAEKALPSDYDANRKCQYKEFDPRLTEFEKNVQLITSIPQLVPGDEIQCEWIVNGSTKAKVLNARGYPARIPKPRRLDLYEVRPTPYMGQGLFAKCDIKCGELILAERPLLVYSRNIMLSEGAFRDHHTVDQQNQIGLFEFEKVLKAAINRFPPESQADYLALHNSHTGDGSGPLFGIARTNNFGIDNLYDGSDEEARYCAVCKIASRINHSCVPNVKNYFKLDSFSMQFYAIRDIKAGDQLFSCYCPARGDVAERQAKLAPYGFVCECTACVNATPETDNLRNTFETRIRNFVSTTSHNFKTLLNLKDALALEKAMIEEGLNAHFAFESLIRVIFVAYLKLGNMEDSEKYGRLIEEFRKRMAGEQ